MMELENKENREWIKKMPPRFSSSHKGDYGRVLVIAGSPGMAGAAYFAAKAAYRTGCGLTDIVTGEENRPILQTLIPEAVLSLSDGLPPISLARADSVLIGCGLQTSPRSLFLLEEVLRQCKLPLVLDADALNLLASHPALWALVPRDTVLTPHAAEMARLCGVSPSEIQSNRAAYATNLASEHNVICVLKGEGTLIAAPDGQTAINPSGNDGMSTGGSGDVLAGMIASLLAQEKRLPEEFALSRLSAFETVKLAVHLHGMAGDIAAERLGRRSMMASDLLDAIPILLRNT